MFVTNWPGAGALPDLLGRSGRGAAKPSGPPAGVMARTGGALGRVGGWLGKAGGRLGGALAIGSAAYQVFDTAKNATTREEKAQGHGGAAGTLAGGLAGAKLGAAVGALGGPIGIAIGGLLGGAIGSFAGDKVGGAAGWASRWWRPNHRRRPPHWRPRRCHPILRHRLRPALRYLYPKQRQRPWPRHPLCRNR